MNTPIGEEPFTYMAIINAMKREETAFALLLRDWKTLGTNLKINASELLDIEFRVANMTLNRNQIIYELLTIWKAQTGAEATAKSLDDTLKKLQHKELSRALQSLRAANTEDQVDQSLPSPRQIKVSNPSKQEESPTEEILSKRTSDEQPDGLPRPRATVYKDADKYRMKLTNRGKAIILNHKTFLDRRLNERHGTEKDVCSLESTLKLCGLQPIIFDDLTTEEELKVISYYSKYDFSEDDCFVMCVLSHGHNDVIYTKDGSYAPNELWTPFEADVCTTLAGKPKLFFIQACRGDGVDSGTPLEPFTDGIGKREEYRIPNKADFLIAYSTVDGHFSFRTTDGTWFIQALCSVLNEHMNNLDLLSMMTLVARKVATEYEAMLKVNKQIRTGKQVPMITSTLIRQVYFK